MVVSDLKQALDLIEKGGCKMGPEWDRAHNIAQAHEGKPGFDRLHALIHRIEGDTSNAAYWYRRAGIKPFSGSFENELTAFRNDLKSET